MKAKELRIGNIVFYPGIKFPEQEVGIVKSIKESGGENPTDKSIFELEIEGVEGFFYEAVIQPVLLTSAFLERIGFKLGCGVANKDGFLLFYNHDLELYGIKQNGKWIKIKYIHQLQNIYFILKNEELNIELK